MKSSGNSISNNTEILDSRILGFARIPVEVSLIVHA